MLAGILLWSALLFIVACEKKDPKPELRDLIYQDMVAQQAEAERIIGQTQSKIEEIKKAVHGARPQSGMLQSANRQIFELQKLQVKMSQQTTYWKLRVFERLKHVRTLSSRGKEEYKTNPREWDAYQSEKKLRIAKNSWDIKSRFKESGFDYDPILLGESPIEAPKKTSPKPSGGGH